MFCILFLFYSRFYLSNLRSLFYFINWTIIMLLSFIFSFLFFCIRLRSIPILLEYLDRLLLWRRWLISSIIRRLLRSRLWIIFTFLTILFFIYLIFDSIRINSFIVWKIRCIIIPFLFVIISFFIIIVLHLRDVFHEKFDCMFSPSLTSHYPHPNTSNEISPPASLHNSFKCLSNIFGEGFTLLFKSR